MRILMLLEHEFPQDERVEKEIGSLLEAGHEIRIATYTFKGAAQKEEYQGYTIYRKDISRWTYKLGAAILILPFYFSFWRSYVQSIYREWPFEVIHIHDLPLARIGTEFKRKKGVFFVADQHEYYSDWIVKTAHYNTLPGKIISLFSNWKDYERKNLKQADLVCTVEEPLRQLYISNRGLDPGKVLVIPNTPLASLYASEPGVPDPSYFTLYYHGNLDRLRGIDVVLQAVAQLKTQIPEIRILLVGKANKYYDIPARADELGVADHLEYRAFVDYQDLPQQVDQADVCFFTPPSNRDEINNSIATKIYQYMARGKPILVGKARYMKQFVEEKQIGLSVDENDPASLARAILRLYREADLRQAFSEKAFKHRSAYFWEQTVQDLLSFYSAFGNADHSIPG